MSADFSFITGRLATGAAIRSTADAEELFAAGITHIIDCNAGLDDAQFLAGHPDISYLFNGVDDDGQHKEANWFKKSLDFALPALSRPGSRVYSHCAAGRNRGPSTAYCILRAFGLTADEAKAMIHLRRPITVMGGIAYASDADAAIEVLGYGSSPLLHLPLLSTAE